MTARSTVVVLEQGVARAQADLADVRQRFNAGLVPPNEIASAEAQESRARLLLIEARNQRDLTSADLARLTGADLSSVLEPASTLEGAPGSVGPIESLLAGARATRNERTALERRN